MSTTKFTPGPWEVWEPECDESYGGKAVTIVIGRDRPGMMQEVAYVNCQSDFFTDNSRVKVPSGLVCEEHWATAPAEAIANARLIAAAPGLYEACRLLADWVRQRRPADDWPREYELATRALAKADGSSA